MHTRDPGLERPTSSTSFLDQLSPPPSPHCIDTEMSNQKVIYSTLRFLQSPSESQSRIRPGGTQSPGKTDDKEFSVPWCLIAVILGILCLLLLVIVTVLGTKIFQYIQENNQQREKIGNLSQEFQTVQNDSCLKKQHLTNKTLEYNSLGNERLLMKMKQNFKEICSRIIEGKLYENHWLCYGISCYYFILETKNWNGCKQTCQSYNSSLLKINDQDELTFIQAQINKNNYWIGLSYNESERKWKWTDSDPLPGKHYTFMNSSGRGQCAFLSSTRTTNIECSHMYGCVCEKTIDNVFSPCINSYKKKRPRSQAKSLPSDMPAIPVDLGEFLFSGSLNILSFPAPARK